MIIKILSKFIKNPFEGDPLFDALEEYHQKSNQIAAEIIRNLAKQDQKSVENS